MFRCLRQLWADEGGVILSSEIVLVGTILVIGAIVGLTSLQHAVTHELNDTARAYDAYRSYPYDDYDRNSDYAIFDSAAPQELAGQGY